MMPMPFPPHDATPKIVAVTPPCPRCGAGGGYLVPVSQYNDWKNGTCARRAFPGLRAEQCEQLETGVCDRCWTVVHALPDEEPQDATPVQDAVPVNTIEDAWN